MSLLHTDQPIRGDADSPDRLNREEYAKRIGRSLLLPKDSPGLVVSLEGPWGYGKTSVINLITRYFNSLEPNDRPIVINFNPWLISGVDNIVQEFLVHLASSIDSSDRPTEAKDAAKQLLSYSKVFTVMKYIPGAEPWATIIQHVIEGVGNVADEMGKLKEQNVDARRDKVIKSLLGLNKSIVIFIDDIDRLPPDEVFAMIRLVKAVADFPRVAYVLAYDESYVNEALTRFGMNCANLYLDKIIQVRLHLPIIDTSDIETLVNEELSKMPVDALKEYFRDNESSLGEIYHHAIKYLLLSPRDVKRLFNRLYITETTVRGEVAFSDLLGLETLALKAPSVYEHMRVNPGAYTGTPDNLPFLLESSEEHINKCTEERTRALEGVSVELRKPLLSLLENLFPILLEYGPKHSQSYYAARGRIAATDRLVIAMTYGLPMKEVPLGLVKSFIESVDKRKALLTDICENKLLERFIELLQQFIQDIEVSNVEDLLLLLAELAESKYVNELKLKPKDFTRVRPIKQLLWLTEKLLAKKVHDERVKILNLLVSDQRHMSLGTFILIYCLRQQGFYNVADKVGADQQWCTDVELTELQAVWLVSVEQFFLSKTLCTQHEKGNIIFLLARLDKVKAKSYCEQLMGSDDDFDCLVSAFGESGRDSVKGRYSQIEEDFLETIGGAERIRTRARQRLDSTKLISTELKAMLMSIITGKKYYLIDASEGEPF
ncbi:MAG: hypothetical protein HZA15_12885 [Nitrospirae bacterium]|nr:hypothetical protein [Nitrospirota bacterium]